MSVLVAIGPLAGLFAGGLEGGALAGTSGTAGDLLRAAFSPWIAGGDGHPGPADPFWAVLALLAVVIGGPLGVATATGLGIFVALSIPLAAVAAWFAAGAATRSLPVRAWAALVWALGPPAIIALAGADIAALVCHLSLPLLGLTLARAFGYDRQDVITSGLVGAARVADPSDHPDHSGDPGDPGDSDHSALVDGSEQAGAAAPAAVTSRVSGTGSLGAAAGAGLLLAITAAAAPFVLPIALLALLVLAVVVRGRRTRLLLVALPPLVLFAPFLLTLPQQWRFFLTTPGTMPDLPGTSAAPAWAVLLGWPGLVSAVPWIMIAASAAGASILLAALVGLLRPAAGVPARIGWLLAAAGLAMVSIVPAAGDGSVGPAVSVMTVGLLIAGTTGLHGLTGGLRGYSFGWRHGLAAGTALALTLGGVGALATGWSTAADVDQYAWRAGAGDRIPALAQQVTQGPDRSRVLALTAGQDGLRAGLWRGNGPQVTDQAPAVPGAAEDDQDEAAAALRTLVAELSVGAASDPAARLAAHAIAVVLVPPAGAEQGPRADLVAALDSVAGLERVTENETGAFWRVSGADPIARVTLVAGDAAPLAVPSDAVTAAGPVDSSPDQRTLVLAERADPGWQAWLDGRRLRAVPHEWQQAFEVPAGAAGDLTVRYEPPGTRAWHVAVIVVFALTALLALPTRRRRREADR